MGGWASPDALAIASTDQAYSYGRLLDVATSWSSAVRAHLAGQPGRPVALPIQTDARGTVALVAVALSGHPVAPIDPMLPTARQARTVDSSGALLLRVDELAALPPGADPVLAAAGADDPAVIFYTAASTVEPKGDGGVRAQRLGGTGMPSAENNCPLSSDG